MTLFRDKKASVLKPLNAVEAATSHTSRTLFVPNYLNFFPCTTTRSALKDIWRFVYTFNNI